MAKAKTIKSAPMRNEETPTYRAILAFSDSCNVEIVLDPAQNTAQLTVRNFTADTVLSGTAELTEVE